MLTSTFPALGDGNDSFNVLQNKCNMELNGESGDDHFNVRSFMVIAEDGSVEAPELGNTTNIDGGPDSNTLTVSKPKLNRCSAFAKRLIAKLSYYLDCWN